MTRTPNWKQLIQDYSKSLDYKSIDQEIESKGQQNQAWIGSSDSSGSSHSSHSSTGFSGFPSSFSMRHSMAGLLRSIAKTKDLSLTEKITRTPQGKRHRIVYDGILIRNRDQFDFGYWVYKDPDNDIKDIEEAIQQKNKLGYSLVNTLFENTQKAVLFQDGRRKLEANIQNPEELISILEKFFSYDQRIFDDFQSEKERFTEQIELQAEKLFIQVEKKKQDHSPFCDELRKFHEYCTSFLNSNTRIQDVEKMLVQHILTESIFQEIFFSDQYQFLKHNRMGSSVKDLVKSFYDLDTKANIDEILKPYSKSIASILQRMSDSESKQRLLIDVYELFFRKFRPNEADRLGNKYTPKEIVDFIVRSIDQALEKEFGKNLGSKNTHILDPCVGTGTFMLQVLEEIADKTPQNLAQKYREELHANEIELLPYYISTLNLQRLYHDFTGSWEEFQGICFADSLDLLESLKIDLGFAERNTKANIEQNIRQNTKQIKKQQDQRIFVVLGNPPYNGRQKDENQANKNKKHSWIDKSVAETYVKGSSATNKNSLYDPYIKFFRFATDRLKVKDIQERDIQDEEKDREGKDREEKDTEEKDQKDGIVCFVSNNSFIEGLAFDGFRKELQKDFQRVYHLDLGGNARKGHSGNVFGIQVGVGITLLIRNKKYRDSRIYYYRVEDTKNQWEKLEFLEKTESFSTLQKKRLLREIKPNKKGNWFSEKLEKGFDEFLTLGNRKITDTKKPRYFDLYSLGVHTAKDRIAYDFDQDRLKEKVPLFIQAYNDHVDRWGRLSKQEKKSINLDHWVDNENPNLKWDGDLKKILILGRKLRYDENFIRESLYRPFIKKYLYFDRGVNLRVFQLPKTFPKKETENLVICVSGIAHIKPFGVCIVSSIPCMDFIEKTQCFPLYRYDSKGNRQENLSDFSLSYVQNEYGTKVLTKEDLFYYLYALLNHAEYQAKYKENLRLELPRVPIVKSFVNFMVLSELGRKLAYIHLNYEDSPPLQITVKNSKQPVHYSIGSEGMKLNRQKTKLKYNDSLFFPNLPKEIWNYKIANRSPLEWIVIYYKNWTASKENPTYLLDLIQKLMFVSIESQDLICRISKQEIP